MVVLTGARSKAAAAETPTPTPTPTPRPISSPTTPSSSPSLNPASSPSSIPSSMPSLITASTPTPTQDTTPEVPEQRKLMPVALTSLPRVSAIDGLLSELKRIDTAVIQLAKNPIDSGAIISSVRRADALRVGLNEALAKVSELIKYRETIEELLDKEDGSC